MKEEAIAAEQLRLCPECVGEGYVGRWLEQPCQLCSGVGSVNPRDFDGRRVIVVAEDYRDGYAAKDCIDSPHVVVLSPTDPALERGEMLDVRVSLADLEANAVSMRPDHIIHPAPGLATEVA